jgi:hypothetical protein
MLCLRCRVIVVLKLVLIIGALTGASPVRGELMYFSDTPAGFGKLLTAEDANHKNILFNRDGLDLSGALVEGYVNSTDAQLVKIGSSELLSASGGQAPGVRALDGAFTDAFFLPHDDNGNGYNSFQSLSFNIDTLLNTPGEAVVRTYDSNNALLSSHAFIVASGNNFLGIIALDGESFARAEIYSNSAIARITQIRAGFVGMPFSVDDPDVFDIPPTVLMTPEPSPVSSWLVVLLPLSLFGIKVARSVATR